MVDPTSSPNPPVVCPSCGRVHDEPVNFCSGCGARLLEDPKTDAYPAVGSPTVGESGASHLLVVGGPNAGSTYALDTPVVTIGRHPDSDVFLEDITVSRRHAELHRDAEGRWTLVDVGSLNGTYLDDERVDSGPVFPGSRLQVGRFKIVVIAGERAGE